QVFTSLSRVLSILFLEDNIFTKYTARFAFAELKLQSKVYTSRNYSTKTINWLEGISNTGKERICPGRHIQQQEWQPKWNEEFSRRKTYDHISDYECPFPFSRHKSDLRILSSNERIVLESAKQQGYAIPIKNLAHHTSKEADIIRSKGFLGGKKKINETSGESVYAYLSWWSTIFDENVVRNLQDHMKNCFLELNNRKLNDIDVIKNQFGASDAFLPYTIRNQGQRCSHSFIYSIGELVESYQQHVGRAEKIEFRILGTFAYKVKVMHTVLVCSESAGKDQFSKYPLIPQRNSVVTKDNEGKWMWYPQATGTKIKRFDSRKIFPMYRRYDCVSFAFHVRHGEIFKTNDVDKHSKKLNN
ncbi:uncharacterized protein LOC124437252, partial [Xenia sp. Carnegie-2017]|uniref:uncharacterized protein LOC124437252 n=1 Tax=Xenia sp. Carnegie-2017 TaxID=2897299 RepID=UPI001F036361